MYHKSCAAYTFDFGRFAKVRCCQLSAGGYWPRARKALSSVRGSKTIKDDQRRQRVVSPQKQSGKVIGKVLSMSPASWRDSVDGHCHCFLFVSRLRMYRACIDEDGPNAPESHVSDRRARRLTCLQVSSELLTDSYRFLHVKTQFTIHFAIHSFHIFSPNSPFHIRISSRNMLFQTC